MKILEDSRFLLPTPGGTIITCVAVSLLLFALLSVLSAEFKSPELSLILFRLLLLLTFEATTLMILKMDKSKAKMLKVPIDSDPKKITRKKFELIFGL